MAEEFSHTSKRSRVLGQQRVALKRVTKPASGQLL